MNERLLLWNAEALLVLSKLVANVAIEVIDYIGGRVPK